MVLVVLVSVASLSCCSAIQAQQLRIALPPLQQFLQSNEVTGVWWRKCVTLCSSIKVKSIRITYVSFPLCSLPWKNEHQLPQLRSINPGSLTVPRDSLWTHMAVCSYFYFPFLFLKFFISIILYF